VRAFDFLFKIFLNLANILFIFIQSIIIDSNNFVLIVRDVLKYINFYSKKLFSRVSSSTCCLEFCDEMYFEN